jgi:hypothetical protein
MLEGIMICLFGKDNALLIFSLLIGIDLLCIELFPPLLVINRGDALNL